MGYIMSCHKTRDMATGAATGEVILLRVSKRRSWKAEYATSSNIEIGEPGEFKRATVFLFQKKITLAFKTSKSDKTEPPLSADFGTFSDGYGSSSKGGGANALCIPNENGKKRDDGLGLQGRPLVGWDIWRRMQKIDINKATRRQLTGWFSICFHLRRKQCVLMWVDCISLHSMFLELGTFWGPGWVDSAWI